MEIGFEVMMLSVSEGESNRLFDAINPFTVEMPDKRYSKIGGSFSANQYGYLWLEFEDRLSPVKRHDSMDSGTKFNGRNHKKDSNIS